MPNFKHARDILDVAFLRAKLLEMLVPAGMMRRDPTRSRRFDRHDRLGIIAASARIR